jgi:hypothetical protein
MSINLSKAYQVRSRGRKPRKGTNAVDMGGGALDVAEVALQAQAEAMLDAYRIEWRRVPDQIWRFLKQSAPVWITVHLAKRWKHKPDLLLLLPIGEGYSLAKEIELKSAKGTMSPGQEDYAARMPVTVCRTPDQTISVVNAAQLQARKCRECQSGLTYPMRYGVLLPGQRDCLSPLYDRGKQ